VIADRPCQPDELRSLFLFEKLTPDQLTWLCREGRVETFEPGPVYTEGDPATCFYVLLEGTLVLMRRVGSDDIEVNRTSDPGVYAGAFQSYLGERAPKNYNSSLRVTVPSRFFVLDAGCFAQLMTEWFPLAVHLLEGAFFGSKAANQAVSQRERLLALGSLSAGLTHELNNPAAAAVSATASLRERISGVRGKLRLIARGPYQRDTLEALTRLQDVAVEKVAKAPKLDPLAAADREDELCDWLAGHGISNGWEIAPALVAASLDPAWLETVREAVGAQILEPAIRWIYYSVETELLMNEIEDATTRISTLVGAARQYSQLDRAPFQVTDVHDLLDSTLMMLNAKLSQAGIKVKKDYDRTLPKIPAYASELNQVWTNLIDNAVYAMSPNAGGNTTAQAGANEGGILTVRTAADSDNRVLVEFGDTGPGIPEDLQVRIFEPFFTTKPVGQGTGLGLDISYRIIVNKHHGDLRVTSRPGDTRFQVELPSTQAQA
jgi:signal transduction histidine kinase